MSSFTSQVRAAFLGPASDDRNPHVEWGAYEEHVCEACGAPFLLDQGRCSRDPRHVIVLSRMAGGRTQDTAVEPRPASPEARKALQTLYQTGTAFLAALEASDGLLHDEVGQVTPSTLASIQATVHNITDAVSGDPPQGMVPVRLVVADLMRRIQEVQT